MSERKLAENEAYFRSANQQIQKDIDKLHALTDDNGEDRYEVDRDMSLHFYCECSDEKCNQRLRISLSDYDIVHQNPKAFVILCDHQVNEYETVISTNEHYCIVEKKHMPPETSGHLNETDLSNK